MNRIVLMTVLLGITTSTLSAPPPQLRAAVQKWAAPASVTRFEYAMVDLNGDKTLDAVVRVTDEGRCGSGGCILLMFKGTSAGYEKVGDSGYVAKPIYVTKEVISGWKSLAGVVGLGDGAGLRPIRYAATEYRSNPIMRGYVESSRGSHDSPAFDGSALTFEVAE